MIYIIEAEELYRLSINESNHSKLSTTQKLELFYSYFQGRPDVYATKWRSKAGKTGFSPHGEGNWIEINKDTLKELGIETTDIEFLLEVKDKKVVLTSKKNCPQSLVELFADYEGEPLGENREYDWGQQWDASSF